MAYDASLERALKLAGGPTAIARAIGVRPSAVTQWQRVPAKWLQHISRLSGIPAEDLRPDLYENLPQARDAEPGQEAA